MALTYTGTNGIFTQCGKPIKYLNGDLTLGNTTLPAEEDAIADVFEAGNADDRRDLAAAVRSFYSGAKDTVTAGWRNQLAGLVTMRLMDKSTVLDQLALPSSDISTILWRLIEQMVLDSASVDASAVTLGSVSAGSGNVGNGTVVTSKVLDGYSSPGGGMMPHIRYNGLDSELAITDSMRLVCVADSQTSGRPEGAELFRWYGNRPYTTFSWEGEGSGEGPGVVVANGSNFISNKDFEIWTGTPPQLVSWDLDAGTAGTHVIQESTAGNVHRGSYALKFTGDGAQASMQISQTINRARFKPRKKYYVSLRYFASSTVAAGQFTVQFEAPSGYTAASSEKIDIAAGSLATSYTHQSFPIIMPATIPVGMELVIKWTGTPTNAKSLWIDSLTICEANWHNGHSLFVPAGATPFKVGDFFTYSVTNDAAGTFQEFFRKYYGVQLPSNAAGAETIVDSLAE